MQINKIKNSMSSAKLYVSTNVVDRLSKPISTVDSEAAAADESLMRAFDSQEAPPGGRPVMDMASFMGSLGGAAGGAAYSTPSHSRPGRPSTGPGSRAKLTNGGGGEEQEGDAKDKALRFEQFLERQKQITDDIAALAAHIADVANPHSTTKTQVGLGNVDNTSDANKPVSTAQQTALDLKANSANPTLTGTPLAPTAAAATNTTQIATTAHVFAERSNALTLTNKTIALGSNTVSGTIAQFNTAVTDADLATLAGSETLTNKTLTAPVIATISNSGTVTLPTGTRTLVARDTTDTLTNKTLTAPIISSISNTGTITLPTSTDTLVGRATTDTLTNKSINLANNTLTGTTAQFNAALSDGDFSTSSSTETLTNKTVNLTSNTLSGTTAQFNTALSDGDFATLAGSETLTNKTLTTPVISSISNSGTVTLPTGTRTLVARDTTDTLTNKSVDLAGNTLTGTTAQFNTALTDGNFATLAGSETLTNKTLTAPVIATISNTGTLTLPTSTDTLVGRATTDTLTNKTASSLVLNDGYTEEVAAMPASAIDAANGSIQTRTISGTTTFTENLSSGQSVVLMLTNGSTATVNWPTTTWVGPGGNVAPTLTTFDVLVFWQVNSTFYGTCVGSGA